MINYREINGALIFSLRVVPNASKSEIVGELGGSLKIKIAALLVDGAANAEIIKFLVKKLGVAKSAVEIISGQYSKNKQVKILNADHAALAKLF